MYVMFYFSSFSLFSILFLIYAEFLKDSMGFGAICCQKSPIDDDKGITK